MERKKRQKLDHLAENERPRERLEKYGPRALRDAELLAILLRTGSKSLDVVSLADEILRRAGSVGRLVRWSREDFLALRGIGKVKATEMLALMEITRRIIAGAGEEQEIYDSPEKVFQLLQSQAFGLEVERFWVLVLNRKNRLIQIGEITSGTQDSSLVHPREVFRRAIQLGAAAIICAHNHPSGDPAPSRADIQVTRSLREAAGILRIELLDHVIVGQAGSDPNGLGYYSFREAGLL